MLQNNINQLKNDVYCMPAKLMQCIWILLVSRKKEKKNIKIALFKLSFATGLKTRILFIESCFAFIYFTESSFGLNTLSVYLIVCIVYINT